MTATAKRHLARIHTLRCVVCKHCYGQNRPAQEAHHIGDSSDRSDWLVIPLCVEHHRGSTGFHGAGERAFNRMYKTNELKLLGLTLEELFK